MKTWYSNEKSVPKRKLTDEADVLVENESVVIKAKDTQKADECFAILAVDPDEREFLYTMMTEVGNITFVATEEKSINDMLPIAMKMKEKLVDHKLIIVKYSKRETLREL